jgi:hypothetical protein
MDKAADWLKVIFWASGIICLWIASAYFLLGVLNGRTPPKGSTPSVGDLATIFFGASSLALIIISLLVAIAALVQWQALKGDIRRASEVIDTTVGKVKEATAENAAHVKSLEEKTQGQLANLEKELRGRVDAVMGATIGNLHAKVDVDIQSDEDQTHLAEAVYHAQRGYDRLKELPGSNGKFMALNSIVYFSCLLRLQSKRDLLLAQGRELRDVGRKYEHLVYSAPYLLTFCRVALVYSSDLDELQQGLGIAQDVLAARHTLLQEKEATYLVASLSKKLADLSRSVT